MPLWRLASIASFEGSSSSVSTAPLCCRQLLLPLCGKCVPDLAGGVGHAFRNGYQVESASRNLVPEWDALSGTVLSRKLRPGIDARMGRSFRQSLVWKMHPSLSVYSGMQFPLEASTGKCVPF